MSQLVTPVSLASTIQELASKTLCDIQYDTAITWTNRACAAVQMNKPNDAKEYAHEAIEHAALTGDISFIQEVYCALAEYGVPYGIES